MPSVKGGRANRSSPCGKSEGVSTNYDHARSDAADVGVRLAETEAAPDALHIRHGDRAPATRTFGASADGSGLFDAFDQDSSALAPATNAPPHFPESSAPADNIAQYGFEGQGDLQMPKLRIIQRIRDLPQCTPVENGIHEDRSQHSSPMRKMAAKTDLPRAASARGQGGWKQPYKHPTCSGFQATA
jgi:hypothetical protein